MIQNDSGMPTPVEIVSEGEPERTAWHSTVPIVVAAPLRTVNFTVPPGQRLVLETVSMAADVALGSDASFFFVLTFATGNTATQDIPIFLETQALGPFAALDRFVGIATGLSIAAEAGSQVSFTVETSPPSSIGEFTASFSGFLEPTP